MFEIQDNLFQHLIFQQLMGCNSSDQGQQVQKINNQSMMMAKRPILTMIGSTVKGSMILNFTQESIQSTKCGILLPKYANAVLKTNGVGYLTGGIQQLQSTINQNTSIQDHLYEGTISKKCYEVNMQKLLVQPDSAFMQLPEMINSRYSHCAIVLNNALYVLGGRQYGDDEVGLLAACEKIDEKSSKWQSIPPLRSPKSGAAAIVYGSHIYIFGGYTGKNTRSRQIQSYSQGDKSWRKLPFQLHIGLQGLVILPNPTSQSSIYILGGRSNFGKCKNVSLINFDTSSVSHCTDLHQSRSYHKAIYHNKIAYIVGGGPDAIELYDIKQGVSQLQKQLSYLQHCSTKDLNSFSQFVKPIVLKNKDKPYISPNFKNKIFIFGHATQPFTKIIDADKMVVTTESQNLKHNFYAYQTCVRVNKEHCFILGGINSGCTEVSNEVYSFNLINQQIKTLDPMKIQRYGFPAIVKGSYLYVLGGRKLGGDDVAILNQCERFSFQTYKWESIPSLKHKRHSSFGVAYGKFLLAIGGYKGNGIRSNEIEAFIQQQNRWIQIEDKFELAAQSMTPVHYTNNIFIFGGRAQQIDIQKVFKLKVYIQQNAKYQKGIRTELQPMGNLTKPGTNLKVFVNSNGVAYVFGNIENGIDVYDLKTHQIERSDKLVVFQDLKDSLFQAYTIAF